MEISGGLICDDVIDDVFTNDPVGLVVDDDVVSTDFSDSNVRCGVVIPGLCVSDDGTRDLVTGNDVIIIFVFNSTSFTEVDFTISVVALKAFDVSKVIPGTRDSV